MIEITCGCKDNSAQPVGVGVINARPSLKMNVRDVKVKSKHQLRSPIKEFYKKCLPLLSITILFCNSKAGTHDMLNLPSLFG